MSAYFKSLARRCNPDSIAIFPLKGTIVLPGCELPLNIFEPRYLNMIDDALRQDRLIGIIQPTIKALDIGGANNSQSSSLTDAKHNPALSPIGTLARIKQFYETHDGRYLITVMGLKRYKVLYENEVQTPYRQLAVDYSQFSEDHEIFSRPNLPAALTEQADERARLMSAMKGYAARLGVKVDWSQLSSTPITELVDQCAMISPFTPADKQSLLEAKTPELRRQIIIGLMSLYSDQPPTNKPRESPN